MTMTDNLSSEEILFEDKEYWLNSELQGLCLETEWGRLYPEDNKQFYD